MGNVGTVGIFGSSMTLSLYIYLIEDKKLVFYTEVKFIYLFNYYNPFANILNTLSRKPVKDPICKSAPK